MAAIECNEGASVACVEVYDMGSTCRLLPYHADFNNFVDLLYQHACSKLTTQLLLHDVLYTLAMGYTLISMGCLDSEEYQASSGEGRLKLTNPDSKRIGLILKSD